MTEPTASAPAPGDADGVRALARAAALPLQDDRLAAVDRPARAWLPAANALSRTHERPGAPDDDAHHRGAHPGPTDRTE